MFTEVLESCIDGKQIHHHLSQLQDIAPFQDRISSSWPFPKPLGPLATSAVNGFQPWTAVDVAPGSGLDSFDPTWKSWKATQVTIQHYQGRSNESQSSILDS